MSILIGFLTVVHVVVALFLIVLVLMQKSKDQGVGAAFGGGVTDTVFGGGTTSALVKMTVWCAALLLVTTVSLAMLHSHRGAGGRSLMQRVGDQVPAAPATIPGGTQLPGLPESALPLPTASPATAPVPEASPQPATPTPEVGTGAESEPPE